jgi:hypothetical protein
LRGSLPRTVFPSRKVTLPVGTPEPGAAADTVAVRVTGLPTMSVAGEMVAGMKMTANDTGAHQEASREAARKRLEEARRIADKIPMESIYSGLGPPKVEKTR